MESPAMETKLGPRNYHECSKTARNVSDSLFRSFQVFWEGFTDFAVRGLVKSDQRLLPLAADGCLSLSVAVVCRLFDILQLSRRG